MFKFNKEKYKEKENDLKLFKGWIPYPLTIKLDMLERNNYLKENGLFNEVREKSIKYREVLKKTDNPDEFQIQELEKWLRDNPEFRGIVIIYKD